MMKEKCSNLGACSKVYMTLPHTVARAIHSFEEAHVEKTAPGRPDNIYYRIIVDSGTRKWKVACLGFSTLYCPKQLQLRIKPSAVLFTSEIMNTARIKNITKQKDEKCTKRSQS